MPTQPYVLLVEDNPGDADLVRAMFEEAPPGSLPELRCEQTVSAACSRLTAQPHCRAVLLDLALPDSNGLEALLSVRERAAQVPIIVLSGNDDESVGLAAVIAGAQDYLIKGSFDGTLLRRAMLYATHRKRLEQELVKRAMHDPLTGLPTRTLLLDRLRVAMSTAARTGARGALLFVDLDRFKQINDQFGHSIGDLVLRTISRRMSSTVRASDTVSRVGGDEFVILLPSQEEGESDGMTVAHKLLAAVSEPIQCERGEFQVTASIGYVEFAGDDADPEDLIDKADASMYVAKREGRDTVR
jgi:diguanylate cyclase